MILRGLCAEGCRALPRSRFRHRGFAEPRNPRRGGSVEGKTKILVRWLARARCPALRSAGLFGSETGSPRTRVAFLRHGYSRGPQYFLAEEMLGWVSRGWSESRTRPADLNAKKSSRPQPQKREKGLSKKHTSCFLKIARIFVFAKTPTPGCGVTKVLRIYIAGGKRTSYELSPPK